MQGSKSQSGRIEILIEIKDGSEWKIVRAEGDPDDIDSLEGAFADDAREMLCDYGGIPWHPPGRYGAVVMLSSRCTGGWPDENEYDVGIVVESFRRVPLGD